MRESRGPFTALPLFWKILLPFLVLIVSIGAAGSFFIVRDVSRRAQTVIDHDLQGQSLDARSVAHDRELYLLESANFAANVQGMTAAIDARDRQGVARLLGSVLALKTDLALLVATNADGRGIVEYRRTGSGTAPERSSGQQWLGRSFVATAMKDPSGEKQSGFLTDGARTLLAIAAPICRTTSPCRAAGVTIAAIGLDQVALDAAGRGRRDPGTTPARGRAAVEIYDLAGHPLAATGFAGGTSSGPATAPPASTDRLVRRAEDAKQGRLWSLYAPFEVQGRRVGTLAVTVPASAYDNGRNTVLRFALILIAAMAGVVGVGAVVSRRMLRQVRPLVQTNRALGRGDLAARTPVVTNDELGELARGVNQMAEQLQASYETLELRVAQRTEEVRRLLAERTEFFASMSHDFRTPLAVIMNEADLLTDQSFARKTGDVKEAARTIKESSAQVLALVNDVLELARAEAGRLEVSLDAVHLGDVLADLRTTIDGLARGGEVSLTVEVPKDLPAVAADRRRLREVILNLVDNAVKYTPSGGRIAVSAAASNGHVEVAVADSGVGIPAEAGDKIFEPFYRVKGTKPARGQPSTGLGLALSKRLVEAHGGDLGFTSEPGRGSIFRFTLRTAGDAPKADGRARKQPAPSRG